MKDLIKTIAKNNNGKVSEDFNYIDLNENEYIVVDTIIEEYEKYMDIQDEIDEYIEENDLDVMINADEIKKHFKKYSEYFSYSYAELKSFDDIIEIKIKNKTIVSNN